MKFSTRQDIRVPIGFAYEQAADFEAHARQAMRRGYSVERRDPDRPVDVGACWEVVFPYRGKPRRVIGELVRLEPPNGYLVRSLSAGVRGHFEVELLALARARTRLRVALELKPETLAARLMIQSARLARSRLDGMFSQRVEKFALETEERFRAGAQPSMRG